MFFNPLPVVLRIKSLDVNENDLEILNLLVPDLRVAPQDEAGLTKTFQTWPRGWFHIP